MKYRKYVIAAIAASIVLLLAVTVVIFIGASNGGIVESPAIPDKTNTSTADSVEVKNKVEQLLKEIMDNGLQVIKAQEYLEEINRPDVPVMSRVIKDRGDDQARKAIYLVTIMRRELPEWNGTREILVNAGGKPPGMKIRCVLETKYIPEGEGQYIITLTKTWDIKTNGIQPVSYWKYGVTGERLELIEEHDQDDMIRIIK